MKKILFKVNIKATAKKVWETLTEQDSYEKWVGVSWPATSFSGKWESGENIKFTGKDGSGTLAFITVAKKYEQI